MFAKTYDKDGFEKTGQSTRYELAGQVLVNGSPAVKTIIALDRGSYTYLCSTNSFTDGKWRIRGNPQYPAQSLLVICRDDTGTYNAEVYDRITQVAVTYYVPKPYVCKRRNNLPQATISGG